MKKESKKQGYALISVSGDILVIEPLPSSAETTKAQHLRGFKKLSHLAQKQFRQ
jgi:hypothetical protein